MSIRLLVSKKEKLLLKKLEEANQEEMLSWKLPNLYYPILVISFSLISFWMFKDSDSKSFVAFINLVLNGSIPMVALNRLSSLGINIFKFDKTKERKGKNNTYALRIKIHYYSMGLVFAIALFYIFQVINTPFDLSWTVLIQLLIAALCVEQSLKVSKYAFLLQEKLMDITFDQEMRIEIKENGHGENWG
ncbi:MAG: hypothetical protein QM668_12080 [Agriterribacter sp.]